MQEEAFSTTNMIIIIAATIITALGVSNNYNFCMQCIRCEYYYVPKWDMDIKSFVSIYHVLVGEGRAHARCSVTD